MALCVDLSNRCEISKKATNNPVKGANLECGIDCGTECGTGDECGTECGTACHLINIGPISVIWSLMLPHGKDYLRQKVRCFLCLKEGHIMCNCKNQLYNCAICLGKYISICDGNDRLPQPTEKQPIRGVGVEVKDSSLSAPKSEKVNYDLRDFTQPMRKTSNNVMHVNADPDANCVLFQTAIAGVSKPITLMLGQQ